VSIRGEFHADFASAPTVLGAVSLGGAPPKQVRFLIDTGATRTTLNPRDADDAFPGYADLDWRHDPRLKAVSGVGGICSVIVRLGVIRFIDDRLGPLDWDGLIEIIEPTANSRALPSLLGRDVLDNFRLTVSKRESLISLEIQLPATEL
jgi:predicted aspartyl protease